MLLLHDKHWMKYGCENTQVMLEIISGVFGYSLPSIQLLHIQKYYF